MLHDKWNLSYYIPRFHVNKDTSAVLRDKNAKQRLFGPI